ncbi:kunitz-type serine protease inhibitor 2-like [Drosophila subobscura]|uniref:kunitz-type serine protease inhibitor 2-like n=1 Tax=Drosophila subobscura TaxID=7241 RepID=UPI00155A490D|nr:kunitz-type serine protease inhibitor 2-like [Drosophila subobscura]
MFWLSLALVFIAIWLVYADRTDYEELDASEQLEDKMMTERKEVCLITRTSYGDCKGKRKMWHFNARRDKCESFIYSNCGGNRNRFYTRQECMEFCGNYNMKRFLQIF